MVHALTPQNTTLCPLHIPGLHLSSCGVFEDRRQGMAWPLPACLSGLWVIDHPTKVCRP